MNVINSDAPLGNRHVDVSRGEHKGAVSSQWFARGPDERYLSLDDLFAATARRRDAAMEEVLEAGQLKFRGSEKDPSDLKCLTPDGEPWSPSHFAFGQMAGLAKMGKATEILRSQPSWLAGLNLQWGLSRHVRNDAVKLYADKEDHLLRAATGPDYGRIFDADLVEVIRRFAGNGIGDSRWKVPGTMNWRDMTYNPFVDVSRETTTLFASDRDVFLFLCDDTHPVEIGKLRNGDPDLVFRGFYAWNSEVGTRSLGIATFWLRAVCQNRNLWGVEDFDELRIIHSKFGNDRFVREAAPALERYADSEPTKLLAGIKAARDANVAHDDEERTKFLTSDALGFSYKQALAIIETHEREEGCKPETVWDMVNGITAVARSVEQQDRRLDIERTASRLMDRATRNLFA